MTPARATAAAWQFAVTDTVGGDPAAAPFASAGPDLMLRLIKRKPHGFK